MCVGAAGKEASPAVRMRANVSYDAKVLGWRKECETQWRRRRRAERPSKQEHVTKTFLTFLYRSVASNELDVERLEMASYVALPAEVAPATTDPGDPDSEWEYPDPVCADMGESNFDFVFQEIKNGSLSAQTLDAPSGSDLRLTVDSLAQHNVVMDEENPSFTSGMPSLASSSSSEEANVTASNVNLYPDSETDDDDDDEAGFVQWIRALRHEESRFCDDLKGGGKTPRTTWHDGLTTQPTGDLLGGAVLVGSPDVLDFKQHVDAAGAPVMNGGMFFDTPAELETEVRRLAGLPRDRPLRPPPPRAFHQQSAAVGFNTRSGNHDAFVVALLQRHN